MVIYRFTKPSFFFFFSNFRDFIMIGNFKPTFCLIYSEMNKRGPNNPRKLTYLSLLIVVFCVKYGAKDITFLN